MITAKPRAHLYTLTKITGKFHKDPTKTVGVVCLQNWTQFMMDSKTDIRTDERGETNCLPTLTWGDIINKDGIIGLCSDNNVSSTKQMIKCLAQAYNSMPPVSVELMIL